MKYQFDLSGQDINLISAAIRLRIEAAEENNDKYWAKKWNDLLIRINRKFVKVRSIGGGK